MSPNRKKSVIVFSALVVFLVIVLLISRMFSQEWLNHKLMASLPEGVTADSIHATFSGKIVAKGLQAHTAAGKEPLLFSADEVRIQLNRLALIKQVILPQHDLKTFPLRLTSTLNQGQIARDGFRRKYESFAELYKNFLNLPWREIKVDRGRLTAGALEAESLVAGPIGLIADRQLGRSANMKLTIDRVAFDQGSANSPLEGLRVVARLSENGIVLENFQLFSGSARLRASGEMSDIKNLIGQLILDSSTDAGFLKAVLNREMPFFSALTTTAKLDFRESKWHLAAKMTPETPSYQALRNLEIVADGQVGDTISAQNVTIRNDLLQISCRGNLLDQRSLNIALQLRTVPLALLNPTSTINVARSAWLVNGNLSGSLATPIFRGAFVSQPGPATAGDSAKGSMEYENGNLTFRNLDIRTVSGRLQGEATIEFGREKPIKGRLALTDLALEDCCRRSGIAASVKGTAGGRLEISGNLKHPLVNGWIKSENVSVGGTLVAPVEVDFAPNLNSIDISGKALNELVSFTAQTSPENVSQVGGKIVFKEINSKDLTRVLGKDLFYGATFSCVGSSKFSLDINEPRHARLNLTLNKLKIEHDGARFVSSEAVVARISDSTIKIEKMNLKAAPGGMVDISGAVELIPNAKPLLNLHARAVGFPLSYAGKYHELLKSAQGNGDAEINIGGDAGKPIFSGRLMTSNSTVKLPFFQSPSAVQHATIEFSENNLVGKPVRLKVGDGSISGSFSYRNPMLAVNADFVNLKGLELSRLLPAQFLTTLDSRWDGTVTLSADTRTPQTLTGAVALGKIEALVADHTFALGRRGNIRLSQGVLEFPDLAFVDTLTGGVFSVSGRMELFGKRNVDIRLLASNADLSLFKALSKVDNLPGKANVELTMRGPADHPQITVTVRR
ncbi:translocation/assembly module TamB domain-containing protein [Candidatus Poribacteria bacterium]|nr:translocation/assembly module TamB domain-containing protein [Candidatus Poribacteria bacterium]